MLPKKHLSGSEKRKKRKHGDQLIESQRGALHKFFASSSNVDVNEVQGQDSILDGPDRDHGQQEHDRDPDHNLHAEDVANEDDQMEEDLIAEIYAIEDSMMRENLQPSSDHENSNGDEQDGSG